MEILLIRKSVFFNEKTKKYDSILARELAKLGAKLFYNAINPIIKENNGVPKFENINVDFSISHSKDIVAVLINKLTTGAPIGFDVEFMKKRDFKALSNYAGFKDINSLRDFYKAWTIYEANFKTNMAYDPKSAVSFVFWDYMFSFFTGIKSKLKMYEIKIPSAKTDPKELITLNLTKDNSVNEITVVAQEINTAVLEFFSPDSLKIE